MTRRAAFLDRDGVLCPVVLRDGKPHPLDPEGPVGILPGVTEACAALRDAGFLLVMATNQPDIARGAVSRAAVEKVNARLQRELQLDAVKVCPHDAPDRCPCRKPAPGMLVEAAAEHGIDLGASYMVGDRWRDIDAGRGAGCRTVFIDRQYAERRPEAPDWTAGSLADAVAWILSDARSRMERGQMNNNNHCVKIFADGAERARIQELCADPRIAGFTTNPTLLRKAGVTDYEAFARDILPRVNGRSVSFEVFSDEFDEMYRQARVIASWGPNVYVKIPITNTRGESSCPLVQRLTRDGVKVNVTAIMTMRQVESVAGALAGGPGSYISIFAGRIADTGRDPAPIVKAAVNLVDSQQTMEVIWASAREVYNVVQAREAGCHIITLTYDLIRKLANFGHSLDTYSLETVQMFRNDAIEAGFTLDTSQITISRGAGQA